jgi:hypothetical protein
MLPQLTPHVVHDVWPWAALLLLGAVHGINPGMGWLFAVALGMQRQARGAVWRALLPLAAGHAVAIGVAAVVVGLVGLAIPLGALRWVVALTLLSVGISKLVRSRHPRWGGMAVGARDIAIWSFLMASAHGAGLMVVPLLLRVAGQPTTPDGHMGHAAHTAQMASALPPIPVAGVWVAIVHTVGYLLVTGLVAVIVYERLGLRLLGRAWFNIDRLWAGALILTAVVTPLVH